MAEFVHNGAEVWNSRGQRPVRDTLLGYFDDTEGHTDLWPVSTASLEQWRAVLGNALDNAAEWPWPQLSDSLLAHSIERSGRPPRERRKCIFVSHRQSDSCKAEHLAREITRHREAGRQKYDVWLDVWDPALGQLASDPQTRAVLTALIIEMGLINSVAVIALMTDASYGSNWIPYEFGRVKTGGPFAHEARACTRDLTNCLHDYMKLAPPVRYDAGRYVGLDAWLGSL